MEPLPLLQKVRFNSDYPASFLSIRAVDKKPASVSLARVVDVEQLPIFE